MKVSLVFLTWNRLDFVKRAVEHNVRNAGYPIEEIVWCDNGSTDGTREWMQQFLSEYRHTTILHDENRGVSGGYNAIYKKIGDVDLVARPSSDMCMPENWLSDMVKAHEEVPKTGIVAMISKSFQHVLDKRYIGETININGKTIQPANALGSIVFKKEILDKGIFLPELGNKYGYEDTIWTSNVHNAGYLNYYIDGLVEDFPQEEMAKYGDYVKWKHDHIHEFERNNPEILKLNKNING